MATRRIRLLIADDGSRSRDGLRALLATWPGVEVVGEASDGRQAMELARELSPEVVVMDARMPVMDGLEATRALKALSPGIRVVVLTIYAEYRAEARAAGADAFLIKGCPTEELLEALAPGAAGTPETARSPESSLFRTGPEDPAGPRRSGPGG